MFSDRQLKSLKPRAAAYKVYEKGSLPGFCLQVTPKGMKTFYLQLTVDGRRRFMPLGRYPATDLKDAREAARAARDELDRGENPLVTLGGAGSAEQRTGTVRDAVDLYVDDMRARGKTSWPGVLAVMERHILPDLGDHLARDIRPAHAQKALAKVIARGVKREHNKVRSCFRTIMQFALQYDHDPRALLRRVRFGMVFNPVDAVPKDRSAGATPRLRNLSWAEIKMMWHAQWDEVPLNALRLMLAMGGLRPTEVLGARISEVDFEAMTLTVPPERFKGRREHVAPMNDLSADIVRWFTSREAFTAAGSDYLMPAIQADNELAHYGVGSLSQYVGRQWGTAIWPKDLGQFIPYDMRRTAKTRMGEMGIAKSVRDRVQGHAMQDVSSIHYDRWSYLPEKREAVESWGARLEETIIS